MMRNFNRIVVSFFVFLFSTAGVWADTVISEGLRDVKAPVQYPSNFLLIIIILVLILAVGFGIYFYQFRKRKTPSLKPIEVKTPYEIALERLQLLSRKGLIPEGRYLEYYQELSDIIRKYFESQFQIRAPEMTSEEFLLNIKNSPRLKREEKEVLAQFLQNCDMVKFAKYSPKQEEAVESFELAKKLIKASA